MAATNDTIDGLLAEFRGYAAGMPDSYHVTMSWADFRKMLTRFEWAHDHDIATATEACARAVVDACVKQREAERKCVALREALEFIAHYNDNEAQMDDPYCGDGHILAYKAKEALGIKEDSNG